MSFPCFSLLVHACSLHEDAVRVSWVLVYSFLADISGCFLIPVVATGTVVKGFSELILMNALIAPVFVVIVKAH